MLHKRSVIHELFDQIVYGLIIADFIKAVFQDRPKNHELRKAPISPPVAFQSPPSYRRI